MATLTTHWDHSPYMYMYLWTGSHFINAILWVGLQLVKKPCRTFYNVWYPGSSLAGWIQLFVKCTYQNISNLSQDMQMLRRRCNHLPSSPRSLASCWPPLGLWNKGMLWSHWCWSPMQCKQVCLSHCDNEKVIMTEVREHNKWISTARYL